MIGATAARKSVRDYCDRTYPTKLTLRADHPFRPLFNHRCQLNADGAVRQGDAIAIVECVIIDDDRATLHYVNLGADMQVFDCTLGPLYAGADYRLVRLWREFPRNEPDAQLIARKAEIVRAALPWGVRNLYAPSEML